MEIQSLPKVGRDYTVSFCNDSFEDYCILPLYTTVVSSPSILELVNVLFYTKIPIFVKFAKILISYFIRSRDSSTFLRKYSDIISPSLTLSPSYPVSLGAALPFVVVMYM